MGLHLTHQLKRDLRHIGLKWQAPKSFTWGNLKRKYLGSFTGAANSASSYSNISALRTANDYKLNTNYRSLRELTGT